MRFLKNFGFGIIYILLLPLLVLAIALAGLYGFFGFVVEGGKGIISFFQGKSFFKPLQEDEEAAMAKERQLAAMRAAAEPQPQQPQATYVQNNYYAGGVPNAQNQAPSQSAPLNNPSPNVIDTGSESSQSEPRDSIAYSDEPKEASFSDMPNQDDASNDDQGGSSL